MTSSTDRQHYREVLAGLAAKTLTKIPALNGRVEKACKLVLGADVALYPDGTALVGSLTDPTRAYQVTGSPATCQCSDYSHAPEHLCCHRLAVGFTRKIQELLAREAPQAAPVEDARSPLPEARASLNFKAQVGAYEVMVTLRGDTEAELFARLQAVLKRPDIRPLPAKPAPRGTGQQWKQRTYQGA